MANPGEEPRGGGEAQDPAPLLLDQTEDRRAEKRFLSVTEGFSTLKRI